MRETQESIRHAYPGEAVWRQRLKEAVNSPKTNIQWCEDEGIHYPAFRYWKRRLTEQKILPQLVEWAEGFVPPECPRPAYFTLQLPWLPTPVHFAAKPAERTSFDWFYWTICASFQEDPRSGALFLFLSRDGGVIYGLRYCEKGFRLERSFLEKGTFHWPHKVNEEGYADITKIQLRQILKMAVE